jgi:hypothetical protein
MKPTLSLLTALLLAPLAALQAADSTPLREGRPVHRNLDRFKVLFNHDGTCVIVSDSSCQSTKQPVGLKQVHGYVDEVADAQCSALLLSSVWGQTIPLCGSDVVPLWKGVGRTMTCPEAGTAGSYRDPRQPPLSSDGLAPLPGTIRRE